MTEASCGVCSSAKAANIKRAVAAALSAATIFLSSGLHAAAASRDKDITAIFEDYEANGPGKETVQDLEIYAGKGGQGADEALFALGYIYSQKREFNSALRAYQRLLDGFPASRLKFNALYEAGCIKYKTGGLRDARELLEAVSSSAEAGAALRAKARIMLKGINTSFSEAAGDAPAIGAILPMSGGYSQFGEDALSGVLLAADVFEAAGAGFEVIVKDAPADAASMEAAVKELASNARVAGIVGPLVSANSLEAAQAAQGWKIPALILSQRDGVTGAGDYVFRNSLTPLAQTSAIAEHAVGRLNVKRVAVLYPQNNYGTELARLFESEMKKRGAAVVKELSYPPGTKDFSDHVRRVFGVQVKERKEGRKRTKEFTPTVSVDAVYIPDFYDSVALIAPYFEYYNIKGIKLLGSNGWNSARLPAMAGRHIEGAVFVDGFFPAGQRPGTEEFTRKFKEVYGREPGMIEAQAYDSARMLIAASGRKGAHPDREAIKARLKALKEPKGAAGALSFDSRGEAVKKLFILTFKDGKIIEAPGSYGIE